MVNGGRAAPRDGVNIHLRPRGSVRRPLKLERSKSSLHQGYIGWSGGFVVRAEQQMGGLARGVFVEWGGQHVADPVISSRFVAGVLCPPR